MTFFLDNKLDGVNIKLILRRRINNAILTIYLPTILILIIVYATNFFKDYFFEAVVTVNLTSLLVLTTLFISVSQSLPPTAYVKMVDIWLIFAQLVPFAEVLLHTWMDILRGSEEREVNHHGTSVKVGETQNTEEKVFVSRINSAFKTAIYQILCLLETTFKEKFRSFMFLQSDMFRQSILYRSYQQH